MHHLVGIFFVATNIFLKESSSSYVGKIFKTAENVKFTPEIMISERGHLKNIVVKGPMQCNIECVRHTKCVQTNVEQLTETTWNCDLFGWGTGTKTSSSTHNHYFIEFPECEGGFLTTIHSGSSYCVIHEPTSWTDAEIKCQEYGSTLATIEDSSEQTDLVNYLLIYGVVDLSYHIGLNDLAEPEVWVWTGTGEIATYYSWGGADPQIGNNERCVTMCAHRNYKWCDVACSGTSGYICER